VIVVGIDPGLTGAIGWVSSITGACGVADLPTLDLANTGMVRQRIDGRALILLLRGCVPANDSVHVVCERMQTVNNQRTALQNTGSLMRTFGAIEAIIDVLGWRVTYVQPITWKRFYRIDRKGLGLERVELSPPEVSKAMKRASLELARRFYPSDDIRLAKHQNRAEALLMARWGLGTLS
jgi:hypothetical protein